MSWPKIMGRGTGRTTKFDQDSLVGDTSQHQSRIVSSQPRSISDWNRLVCCEPWRGDVTWGGIWKVRTRDVCG